MVVRYVMPAKGKVFMMEKLLQAFSYGQVQDCITLLNSLLRHGKTVADLRAYASRRRDSRRSDRPRARVARKTCPACCGQMIFAPVNTGPRDQTGDGSTGVWICSRCRHEEWSMKPIHEIVRELASSAATCAAAKKGGRNG